MKQIKYIIEFLFSLTTHPEQTWTALAQGDTSKSKAEYMQRNYYFPLLGFMSLVVFLCAGFRGAADGETFDLQHAMMRMVPTLVAYFVGPYLALFVIKQVLVAGLKMSNPDANRLLLFVLYSTSFLVALEVLTALFPSIRFLQIIGYYLIYITWCGSFIYIRVDQGKRWLFGFVAFLTIYMSPVVIELLLHLFQR